MAANLVSLSNNGISAATQTVVKSSSERQTQKDVADVGKALQAGDIPAAQTAVASLQKGLDPTSNGPNEIPNAVKALDQTLKAGDLKGANEAFSTLQQAQQKKIAQPAARPVQAASAAPAQAPARPAQQIQRSSGNQQQTGETAFFTRQDLSARGAQSAPPSALGRNIDTTA